MKIIFFCEQGSIREIGTGHYWRSKALAAQLIKNGHKVSFLEDDVIISGPQVMVIDHIHSKKDLINRAKLAGMKVVLIDGDPMDVPLVDISVSAFVNPKAMHKGISYAAFPTTSSLDRYKPYKKSNSAFIGVGGFDANNYAEMCIRVLGELGINAIVAKSNNHPDFRKAYTNVEMFEEDDYYTAMRECTIGIVNGGLTLFQALYFGLPCIAISQYEHQKTNISYVEHCCLSIEPNENELKEKIQWLMQSEYYREDLSRLGQHFVDGKGLTRICKLIEGLA